MYETIIKLGDKGYNEFLKIKWLYITKNNNQKISTTKIYIKLRYIV